jgi:hypothetical protein
MPSLRRAAERPGGAVYPEILSDRSAAAATQANACQIGRCAASACRFISLECQCSGRKNNGEAPSVAEWNGSAPAIRGSTRWPIGPIFGACGSLCCVGVLLAQSELVASATAAAGHPEGHEAGHTRRCARADRAALAGVLPGQGIVARGGKGPEGSGAGRRSHRGFGCPAHGRLSLEGVECRPK